METQTPRPARRGSLLIDAAPGVARALTFAGRAHELPHSVSSRACRGTRQRIGQPAFARQSELGVPYRGDEHATMTNSRHKG